MFVVKGRDGVDLAIEIFFLVFGIPINVSCSLYFEQMVCATNDGLVGYKALDHEKLQTMLVDKERTFLKKVMMSLKEYWSVYGFHCYGWLDGLLELSIDKHHCLFHIRYRFSKGP